MNYPSELTFDDFIDVAYELAAQDYHKLFNHDGLKGPIKLYMKNNEWCADIEMYYHTPRIPSRILVFTYTAQDVMNYTGSSVGF